MQSLHTMRGKIMKENYSNLSKEQKEMRIKAQELFGNISFSFSKTNKALVIPYKYAAEMIYFFSCIRLTFRV